MRPIGAHTRLVTLLGEPVDHSLSPLIQNAAFTAAKLDGVYVALSCDASDLAGLLRGVARAGGAGNVTVPHKEAAAGLIERPTRAVSDTGACNTFWFENGRIHGDNTDVIGFQRAVEELLAREIRGLRVLLLGAGGAARGVLHALVIGGAAQVMIVNRSPEKARALVERLDHGATRVAIAPAAPPPGEFDLTVNATRLGLHPEDAFPLDIGSESQPRAVLDLVYSATWTPWVRYHRERGIPAADGLEMLIHQGAAAFERWWGIPAPLAAMRAALPPR